MPTDTNLLQDLLTGQRRIETKLDVLLEALAADDDEQPQRTLDGEAIGAQRDASTSLDG